MVGIDSHLLFASGLSPALGGSSKVSGVALLPLSTPRTLVLLPLLPILRSPVPSYPKGSRSASSTTQESSLMGWLMIQSRRSFGNDAMFATNEAFRYLSAKYCYLPIFTNGTTLYSAKLDDGIALTLAGIAQYPTLTIAPMFAD